MITHRGVAYYPEFWPQERWDEDVRLMQEAGINLVRIGEFAWTAMEPAEGVFTLDWLHAVLEHGLHRMGPGRPGDHAARLLRPKRVQRTQRLRLCWFRLFGHAHILPDVLTTDKANLV